MPSRMGIRSPLPPLRYIRMHYLLMLELPLAAYGPAPQNDNDGEWDGSVGIENCAAEGLRIWKA